MEGLVCRLPNKANNGPVVEGQWELRAGDVDRGVSRGNRIHAVGAGWQTAVAAWQVVAVVHRVADHQTATLL
jgi:hypothetical protein